MQRDNLGLKVIALVLAVASWFYISGELNRSRPGSLAIPRPPAIPKP